MLNRWMRVAVCVVAAVGICACSSSNKTAAAPTTQPLQAVADKNNPAAKYLEIAGFRMREKTSGKLDISFAVINHSDADLGDLSLIVNMRTTAAKPGEAPLLTFAAKVSGLGPEEMKEAVATVPTKLRIYELPDWQFIRCDFRVAEPR
ncbi:MAG: hypothetical protein JO022_11335 [Acidobacteriaceae bacterium]|nr:hypothetical protein [Acidobacteriaceae bacterium]